MTALLALLQSTRTARREAALARVQAQGRTVSEAGARLASASAALDDAQGWRRQAVAGRAQDSDLEWFRVRLAGIDAAIDQRRAHHAEAAAALGEAAEELERRRKALSACEKGLMRGEELAQMQRSACKLARERFEESLAEDLAGAALRTLARSGR